MSTKGTFPQVMCIVLPIFLRFFHYFLLNIIYYCSAMLNEFIINFKDAQECDNVLLDIYDCSTQTARLQAFIILYSKFDHHHHHHHRHHQSSSSVFVVLLPYIY